MKKVRSEEWGVAKNLHLTDLHRPALIFLHKNDTVLPQQRLYLMLVRAKTPAKKWFLRRGFVLSFIQFIEYFYCVKTHTAFRAAPVAVIFLRFFVEKIQLSAAKRTWLGRFVPHAFEKGNRFIAAFHIKSFKNVFFHFALCKWWLIWWEQTARDFEFRKGIFFAGILCVFQEKVTHLGLKRSARCRRRFNQHLLKC